VRNNDAACLVFDRPPVLDCRGCGESRLIICSIQLDYTGPFPRRRVTEQYTNGREVDHGWRPIPADDPEYVAPRRRQPSTAVRSTAAPASAA